MIVRASILWHWFPDRHRYTLARAICQLVGRLDNKAILDFLISQDVISWTNYDSIRSLDQNTHEQARSLISLLSRTGPGGFRALCIFLENNNDVYQGLHKTLLDIHDSITEGVLMINWYLYWQLFVGVGCSRGRFVNQTMFSCMFNPLKDQRCCQIRKANGLFMP